MPVLFSYFQTFSGRDLTTHVGPPNDLTIFYAKVSTWDTAALRTTTGDFILTGRESTARFYYNPQKDILIPCLSPQKLLLHFSSCLTGQTEALTVYHVYCAPRPSCISSPVLLQLPCLKLRLICHETNTLPPQVGRSRRLCRARNDNNLHSVPESAVETGRNLRFTIRFFLCSFLVSDFFPISNNAMFSVRRPCVPCLSSRMHLAPNPTAFCHRFRFTRRAHYYLPPPRSVSSFSRRPDQCQNLAVRVPNIDMLWHSGQAWHPILFKSPKPIRNFCLSQLSLYSYTHCVIVEH